MSGIAVTMVVVVVMIMVMVMVMVIRQYAAHHGEYFIICAVSCPHLVQQVSSSHHYELSSG